MGPKTDELIRVLGELTTLLRAHGDEHWASWLEWDRLRLLEHDFRGVEHHLTAYGTMGSFNDFSFGPENVHHLDGRSIDAVNAKLWDLRERAWTLAAEIEREAEFE